MQDTLDTLLRRMGSRRYETWKPAALELARFGPAAIEPLVRLMTHGEYDIQVKATFVLGAMDDVRVLAYLIPLLRDESAGVAGDALRVLRALSQDDGSLLARKILAQTALTGGERYELLQSLQRIVPRDWNAKLRFPLGSLHLYCKRMAREEDEAAQAGAKAVLDYMTLPRASQRHIRMSPAEMLRSAMGVSARESK